MSRFILDLSLTDIDESIENSRGYNPYRDSDGRFASGPGGSSGGGRVGGKKLSEEDLEASMSEAGIERDYVGTRNETLTAIAAKNGFNKKPEKVSPEEFEKMSLDNLTLYRGYSPQGEDTPQKYMKEFTDGEYWAGNGNYGAGTYTFADSSKALSYADGSYDNIQAMILKKNSKIGDYATVNQEFRDFSNNMYNKYAKLSEKHYSNGNDALGSKFDLMSDYYSFMDFGAYAAYRGYDAIKWSPKSIDDDPRTIYVVLNRGQIIVPGEV